MDHGANREPLKQYLQAALVENYLCSKNHWSSVLINTYKDNALHIKKEKEKKILHLILFNKGGDKKKKKKDRAKHEDFDDANTSESASSPPKKCITLCISFTGICICLVCEELLLMVPSSLSLLIGEFH